MKIHFLGKSPLSGVSGGNLYNRQVLSFLAQAGWSVIQHGDPNQLMNVRPGDGVIVDSIVLADVADQLVEFPGNPILLLHVVPHDRTAMVVRPPSDAKILEVLLRKSLIIVTGSGSLELVQDIAPGGELQISCIEPGVPGDWREKTNYRSTARSLLYVANYEEFKGQRVLLEALDQLDAYDWSLEMIGNPRRSPGFYRELQRWINEKSWQGRVILSGDISHDEVNRRMIEADLLVHLSAYESYATVIAEAIAGGLPVLAGRTGNHRAFEASGLISYTDDTAPAGVAKRLEKLMAQPGDYASLRRHASWKVRTWVDVGREFLSALERHQWT